MSPVHILPDISGSVLPAPPAGLRLKGGLPWNTGPRGRDSAYAYQDLGWPWTRKDGLDLIVGIRLSAIGDGSCWYHSVYKSIGKLRNLFNVAPLFNDIEFVKTLDYIDVDYRDPAGLAEYVRKKRPPPEYLRDTFTHRQYLVDTFRNDLFRWFLQPTRNLSRQEYYTEEEARFAINNDVRNMRIWIEQDVLNPNRVSVITTDAEASRFLDLLMGGNYIPTERAIQEPAPMRDVYATYIDAGVGATAIRLDSKEIANLREYMSAFVVNKMAGARIEETIISSRLVGRPNPIDDGLGAGFFLPSEAQDLIVRILSRQGRGMIRALLNTARVLMKSNFVAEVRSAYEAKLSTREMLDRLRSAETYASISKSIRESLIDELKVGNPKWYQDRINDLIASNTNELTQQIESDSNSEYTLEDIPDLQRDWIQGMLSIGLDRLSDPDNGPNWALNEEVKDRLSPDKIRSMAFAFFSGENWGVLAPLMSEGQGIPNIESPRVNKVHPLTSSQGDHLHVLTLIDKLLADGMTGYNAKEIFRQRLTGPYLAAIESYIDTRFTLLDVIKRECGFNTSRYVYERYTAAYLDTQLVDSEAGWSLVQNSINKRSGQLFTTSEVQELKDRDPRKIEVNGYPLACLYVRTGNAWQRTKDLDPEMMRLRLNINYFMTDFGFHLRSQVYESNIRSLRMRVPVYQGRHDAGEDVLPWFSRLLGINSHIVQCYGGAGDLVWLYRTYTSGDLNVELPRTPHIVVNNSGGHYEVFGVVESPEKKTSSSPEITPARAESSFGVSSEAEVPLGLSQLPSSLRPSPQEQYANIVTLFAADHPLIWAIRKFPSEFTAMGKHLNVEQAYNRLVERKELNPREPTPRPPVRVTSEVEGEKVDEPSLADLSLEDYTAELLPDLPALPPLPPLSGGRLPSVLPLPLPLPD